MIWKCQNCGHEHEAMCREYNGKVAGQTCLGWMEGINDDQIPEKPNDKELGQMLGMLSKFMILTADKLIMAGYEIHGYELGGAGNLCKAWSKKLLTTKEPRL